MQGRWRQWAALLLMLVFFAQALTAAEQLSMTIDEGLHVTSGYTILRTGDYRLVEEHPPLVKMWAALPLLPITDLPDPRALPPWNAAAAPTTDSLPLIEMTRQLLYPYRPLDRVIVPPRVMIALLGVLLGAVVYRWASDLRAPLRGLLALLLLVFDPNLLAHASVTGTDLGAACFITLALFCLHRALRRPNLARLTLTGIALGLAQGAKLSALLLLPIVALLLMLFCVRARCGSRGYLEVRALILVFALLAVTLWALYGFEVVRLFDWPLPLPAGHHAIPWLRLREHMVAGHEAFLLGTHSSDGWWFYFPLVFLLKTPLPTLILVAWASARLSQRILKQPSRVLRRVPETLTLALFPLLYILTSLTSRLNIGYRHLLPVLPFLYIGMGVCAPWRGRLFHEARIRQHAAKIMLLILVVWQIGSSLTVAPHYLTFFNEIAGGPKNGWRYLADSNTDWGQGYKGLARFQRVQGIGKVQLSAFIFYDPALYGVVYEPLTPYGGDTPPVFPSRFAPPAGDYVISATTLDGIPLVDPEMYDWFRWREPDAKIANALFYYKVRPEETETHWVAQCVTPTAPLDAEDIAFGFGRDDLRQITFDCTQSWILPQPPGHYALHGALLGDAWAARLHYRPPQAESSFVTEHLERTDIIYRQRRYGALPAFALYRMTTVPGSPTQQRVWAAPAGTPPGALKGVSSQRAPVALDGPLTFLGVYLSESSEALEVETWWRVEEGAVGRPLSIMAHLLDVDGQTLGVADGLGVPPEQWRTGDVVVQRHRFPVQDEPPLILRTGAYWLDDGQRWPVQNVAGADALFVPLQ
ncbi:MAG: phospholipid carrier-dependent glycosyltransferase [Anaerolineae bacterium]